MPGFEFSLSTEIRLDTDASAPGRAAQMLRRDMRAVLSGHGRDNEIVLMRSKELPP